MEIDITRLLNNSVSSLPVSGEVTIPSELLVNSRIDKLENIIFNGKIMLNEDDDILVTGNISGIMHLKDDVTLEPVLVNFDTECEEILAKKQNILDITEILWQNILVDVPSKVRSTNEEIDLIGDGWRVISEETFLKERSSANNPFANLDEMLKAKEDK